MIRVSIKPGAVQSIKNYLLRFRKLVTGNSHNPRRKRSSNGDDDQRPA
jgi:hypothetical protein